MKGWQAVLGTLAAAVTLAVVALTLAVPASADAPTEIPFEFVFDDVNPCTGDIHTVTIAGTTSVHEHDGRIVAFSDRTITTSPTGFVGHGTDTEVDNGQVFVFRLADIATNPSGDRFMAEFVIVVDLSTGTTRVERGELTCLGP
jgi:predicted RNA-binding protein with TRAM domain